MLKDRKVKQIHVPVAIHVDGFTVLPNRSAAHSGKASLKIREITQVNSVSNVRTHDPNVTDGAIANANLPETDGPVESHGTFTGVLEIDPANPGKDGRNTLTDEGGITSAEIDDTVARIVDRAFRE